jgi:hypothetical protein
MKEKFLDRKLFESELLKVQISFPGFEMTRKKADLWYEIVKKVPDIEWKEMIKDCLIYCHRTPSLADILDMDNYYHREKK